MHPKTLLIEYYGIKTNRIAAFKILDTAKFSVGSQNSYDAISNETRAANCLFLEFSPNNLSEA